VLNNDRKIGLIEETAHGLQYAPGTIRMPVLANRQNGQLGSCFNRSAHLGRSRLIAVLVALSRDT
jgi:hypothetical protein